MRILLVLALTVVAFLAFKPDASKTMPKEAEPAVVRLHDLEGNFFCSGVVVGKKTLLTAAHCIDTMPKYEVAMEVRAADGKRTGVLAWVAGANGRADFAVVKGNFSRFNRQKHITDPKQIFLNLFNPKKKYMTCGYPWGGELFCMTVKNLGTYRFHISGKANLYPGMSGGPIIDEQGNVVAVNSAMYETFALFAPIVEIYAATRTKPE